MMSWYSSQAKGCYTKQDKSRVEGSKFAFRGSIANDQEYRC